jgi:hypothetical protein
MTQGAKEFLSFGGKNIPIITDKGIVISIKPICNYLNLDYELEKSKILNDNCYQDSYSTHLIEESQGRFVESICLSELEIYGWILRLKSKNQKLNDYKMECYDVLYNAMKFNK